MKYSDVTAVILCAGKGERAELGYNKVFFKLQNGKTVLDTTLEKFCEFEHIILVHSDFDANSFSSYPYLRVVGGATRGESVANALKQVYTPFVIIHDCARPFVTSEVIADCVEKTKTLGCGVAAVKETNSLKKIENGKPVSVNRDDYYEIQTPQGFVTEKLISAYERVGTGCTDDSEVFEKAGFEVVLSKGSYFNKKLTSAADFNLLDLRIGEGFDVHQLVPGRKLILGGVQIEHHLGLLGHSDADVLVHAIMDALLSGAGLKDIGQLFPDTDPAYEGADSCKLLDIVVKKIKPYSIVNVSATVMAQKPKMAPHIPAMRQRLADIMKIDYDCVNISATTTERLGICGEEKGIAASATVLLKK